MQPEVSLIRLAARSLALVARVHGITLVLTGCGAPAPVPEVPGRSTTGAQVSPGAPAAAGTEARTPAPAPPGAPGSEAPDLLAACVEGTVAVIQRDPERLPQTTLAGAFAAVKSGDRLRLCPGVRELAQDSESPEGPVGLRLADVSNVTIDGTDFVLLARSEATALSFVNLGDTRIQGLTVSRATGYAEDLGGLPAMVRVEGGHGVTLTGLAFGAARTPALALDAVAAVSVEDSLFVDAAVGIQVDAAVGIQVDVTAGAEPKAGARVVGSVSSGLRLRANRFVAVDEPIAPAALRSALTDALPAVASASPPDTSTAPPSGASPRLDAARFLKGRRVLPVTFVEDRVYLVLAHDFGRPAEMGLPAGNDYEAPPFKPRRAPNTMGATVLPRAERGAITLFTPTGPCAPKVGPPTFLCTDGCIPSWAGVLALEGCGSVVAPFAVTGADVVPLSWSPPVETRLPLTADAVPAGPLRAFLQASLRDSLGQRWARLAAADNRAFVRWQTGTEAERLEALLLGFQYDFDTCNTFGDTYRGAWQTVAGSPPVAWPIPPALLRDRPLAGTLLHEGRIAALVGRSVSDVVVYLRAGEPDGGFKEAWSAEFWNDNEECTPFGTAVDFESPCAP